MWEYEDVMILVHLRMEKNCLIVVISVLNLCFYIYKSVCSSPSTHTTILTLSIASSSGKNSNLYLQKSASFFRKTTGKKKPPSVLSPIVLSERTKMTVECSLVH